MCILSVAKSRNQLIILRIVLCFLMFVGSNVPYFLLLHGTGGNEEDLIPMACNISSETTIINPRGKLLDNGIAVQFS
jgi:hypothetical protein